MTKLKRSRFHLNNQRGIGIVETLVAVAILGTSVVAFIVSLSTGSLAVNALDQETTAQSLAQTQMEYTKNYAFIPGTFFYPVIPDIPDTYYLFVFSQQVPGADMNIQKITVFVIKDGVFILTLSDYKVNR
jgi:type II secretory pathway pseudopilin PulG